MHKLYTDSLQDKIFTSTLCSRGTSHVTRKKMEIRPLIASTGEAPIFDEEGHVGHKYTWSLVQTVTFMVRVQNKASTKQRRATTSLLTCCRLHSAVSRIFCRKSARPVSTIPLPEGLTHLATLAIYYLFKVGHLNTGLLVNMFLVTSRTTWGTANQSRGCSKNTMFPDFHHPKFHFFLSLPHSHGS